MFRVLSQCPAMSRLPAPATYLFHISMMYLDFAGMSFDSSSLYRKLCFVRCISTLPYCTSHLDSIYPKCDRMSNSALMSNFIVFCLKLSGGHSNTAALDGRGARSYEVRHANRNITRVHA